MGLISTEQGALAVWTDTRAGTLETQKQELAKVVAAMAEPEGLPEPVEAGLRYGGLALALALALALFGPGLLVLWRPLRRASP